MKATFIQSYVRVKQRGFTLVELMIVTLAIVVLAGIVIDISTNDLQSANDRERAADIGIISSQLERYYRTSPAATGATYPPTSVGVSGLAQIVANTNATIAPNQTGSSLKIATGGSAQSPSISQYTYQPFNTSGGLCTVAPCVRYRLYYRTESSNEIVKVDSMRQQ